MRARVAGPALAALAVLAGLTACASPPGAAPAPGRTDDTLTAPAALGGFGALRANAVPSGDVLKPDCVPHSGPPYQIGAVGSFGGGSVTLVDGVSVSGIAGRFCAVATVVPAPPDTHPTAKVCAQLTAPEDGISFDPVQARLSLIPGVTSVISAVTIAPRAFSAFVCDDGTPGQLRVDTVIQAAAVPQVFGTACQVGPVQASVTGSFSGPLSAATATLSSGPFPVAAVEPGPLCPAGLAQNTNAILGLPLQSSAAGLTISTTAALYLPPP
jgi:hypothetical protein